MKNEETPQQTAGRKAAKVALTLLITVALFVVQGLASWGLEQSCEFLIASFQTEDPAPGMPAPRPSNPKDTEPIPPPETPVKRGTVHSRPGMAKGYGSMPPLPPGATQPTTKPVRPDAGPEQKRAAPPPAHRPVSTPEGGTGGHARGGADRVARSAGPDRRLTRPTPPAPAPAVPENPPPGGSPSGGRPYSPFGVRAAVLVQDGDPEGRPAAQLAKARAHERSGDRSWALVKYGFIRDRFPGTRAALVAAKEYERLVASTPPRTEVASPLRDDGDRVARLNAAIRNAGGKVRHDDYYRYRGTTRRRPRTPSGVASATPR